MNAVPAHPAAALTALPVALCLLLALISIGTASAQPPPACGPATLGMTACLAGKMCACNYDRGGIATGIPAGYRWDCGILRPGCGNPLDVPATLNPYPGPYPSAVSIDRSHHNFAVEQTTTSTNTNLNANTRLPPRKPARPPWTGDPLPLLPPD